LQLIPLDILKQLPAAVGPGIERTIIVDFQGCKDRTVQAVQTCVYLCFHHRVNGPVDDFYRSFHQRLMGRFIWPSR